MTRPVPPIDITRRAALSGIGASVVAPPAFAQQRQRQQQAQQAPAPPPEELRQTLTLAPTRARLRPNPNPEVDVWAAEGAVPGRPVRLKLGQRAAVTVNNRTESPLALHWQGVRGFPAMDGVGGFSQEPIPPGGSFEYRFTPPDAGTYMYRPIMLGLSGPLQDRGLTGALIVEEPTPPQVDQDITVIIDDWLLADDNKHLPFERGPGHAAAGRLGNWVTVNGRPPPERLTAPQGSRIRLRLISACNARIMRLRFEGMRPYVIAVDGQPTDTFEPLRASLPFAPGTRYDMLVDVTDDPQGVFTIVAQVGAGIPLFLLSATERRVQRPVLPPIGPIPGNTLLPPMIRLQDSLRAEVSIEGGARLGAENRLDLTGVDLDKPWSVNGGVGDKDKPLFRVQAGRPVTLAVTNKTAFVQVLHVHGHAFRLLHPLDDGWEPYWLDTVQIPEGRTLRIAFRAEAPGKWLMSSGVAERFDAGLWTWFEVT
jgi:FtsP/CotA-like multicopper oxidase with cupredoxin domain